MVRSKPLSIPSRMTDTFAARNRLKPSRTDVVAEPPANLATQHSPD